MISREEVHNLANLARLQLTELELEKLTHDLGSILGYVEQLKEVESTPVGAEAEAHLPVNVLRADEEAHASGVFTARLVEAAPKHDEAFVRVKKIL
jgi:aspartyl-tRNA(Asn)/glutamyl-tRNA(Gln) amidotransferase subunit C